MSSPFTSVSHNKDPDASLGGSYIIPPPFPAPSSLAGSFQNKADQESFSTLARDTFSFFKTASFDKNSHHHTGWTAITPAISRQHSQAQTRSRSHTSPYLFQPPSRPDSSSPDSQESWLHMSQESLRTEEEWDPVHLGDSQPGGTKKRKRTEGRGKGVLELQPKGQDGGRSKASKFPRIDATVSDLLLPAADIVSYRSPRGQISDDSDEDEDDVPTDHFASTSNTPALTPDRGRHKARVPQTSPLRRTETMIEGRGGRGTSLPFTVVAVSPRNRKARS